MKIFLRQRADFGSRFFLAETHGQIIPSHAAMPGINPIDQRATRAAKSRNSPQRQHLDEANDRSCDNVEEAIHLNYQWTPTNKNRK